MPAPKGTMPPNAGKGRPKGSVNRSTEHAREAIARLVDNNAARFEGWLEDIERKHGSLAAWRCMMDVIEYHIPKLQRSELTGPGGSELNVTVHKFSD